VSYAYRELGPEGGTPVILLVHLAETLDDWDPRIVDPIAKDHHVITFDNRGVGASSGKVPDDIGAMADDAVSFIKALGFEQGRPSPPRAGDWRIEWHRRGHRALRGRRTVVPGLFESCRASK
jgi:pimeloyl-ACP methyl ester carboxylesterase